MITTKYRNARRTELALNELSKLNIDLILDKYGQIGLEALKASTPRKTGFTAESWSYEIIHNGNIVGISWNNSHVEKEYANIAVLLDVGHGTANGGYVSGRNYIDPALAPVFEGIAAETWTEVTRIV